jgi:hypothetical protein
VPDNPLEKFVHDNTGVDGLEELLQLLTITALLLKHSDSPEATAFATIEAPEESAVNPDTVHGKPVLTVVLLPV